MHDVVRVHVGYPLQQHLRVGFYLGISERLVVILQQLPKSRRHVLENHDEVQTRRKSIEKFDDLKR